MTDALPPGPKSTIADRLRWAREMRGYTSDRNAATVLGLVLSTYRKHESGERGEGGLKDHHIQRYARAFQLNDVWLRTGKGHPTRLTDLDLTPEEVRLIQAFRATKAG